MATATKKPHKSKRAVNYLEPVPVVGSRAKRSLFVWRLDRLGRSLKHLLAVVEVLEGRGVGFISLQEGFDTTTSGGKLIFQIFGALSEFERNVIRERGRMAKFDAHNLWDRLKEHETAVLLFAKDPHVPFTNNRAERDLRMAKVKQKVSGCFRSEQYARAYCRISSYLQTMAAQGINPLVAIQLALTNTTPGAETEIE